MTQGTVRPARPDDVPEILELVRELAAYERSLDSVEMTPAGLTALLFGGTQDAPGVAATTPSAVPAAYCHVVEHRGDGHELGGCAIWFLNVSTWTGTHGLYLEDLFVRPQLRGSGYGTALLATLAGVCIERGYRRLEWWVLNDLQVTREFYRKIGAVPMDEWTVQRLTGDALTRMAEWQPNPARPAGLGE